MNIQQYLDKNRANQKTFLEYLEQKNNADYQNLYQYVKELKIKGNKHELGIVLQLILAISDNHRRSSDFFKRIEAVLIQFKDEIKEKYTNFEIFQLFKNNKRILLFLIKEQIMEVDEYVAEKMLSDKFKDAEYMLYFYPELQNYVDVKNKPITDYKFKSLTEKGMNFYELERRVGENNDPLCQFIQGDLIHQFISHVRNHRVSLTSTIESSVFETNQFLIGKKPTLIEYSAFFGSVQIFKHLLLNGAKLTPSIWIYAIHGNNLNIIQAIEEKRIKPEDQSYIECIKESIKCHHNEITNYIQTKIMKTQSIEDYKVRAKAIKFINFEYLPNDLTNPFYFYKLCQHNYITLVDLLLKLRSIDTSYHVIQSKKNLIKFQMKKIFIKFQFFLFFYTVFNYYF